VHEFWMRAEASGFCTSTPLGVGANVFRLDPSQQVKKGLIYFWSVIGRARQLCPKAVAVTDAPSMELSRMVDPNFGVLLWSALEVVAVDIAVSQSPLPSAPGIKGCKDCIDRFAATEIVAPGNRIHFISSDMSNALWQ
jgi:hypothetical protein